MNCCLTLSITHEPLCVILPWNDPNNMRFWHALWGDVLAEHCAYTPWDRFKLWYSCAEQQRNISLGGKKRCRHTMLEHMAAHTVEFSSSLLFTFISLSVSQTDGASVNTRQLISWESYHSSAMFLFTTIATFYRHLNLCWNYTTREAHNMALI